MKENTLSYTTRIGKTTFIVNVKQSERAKKPLNTVFQEIRKFAKIILTNSFPKARITEPRQGLPSSITCQS